jgi:hypothetical protein
MLVFAATIFLSAFLLFQVQPMIAKIILPWFGGSAAVWSAAMLFFQSLLLAGYAYAHWIVRKLNGRQQMILHGVLLVASLATLPVLPSPTWKPSEAGDPTFRIILLLGATIGLPYLILSSTSPLLQAWYVRRSGSAAPYRLFALSNLGSLLALVSYPALVEPAMAVRAQAWSWSAGFVVFAALCFGAAWISRRGGTVEEAESPADTRPPASSLVLWVGLAAAASILLVAITNHLSQNVAPIPLLWVAPLTLYLLTFILCFESDRYYHRGVFVPLAFAVMGGMAYLIYANSGNPELKWAIPSFLGGLFICCMVCHGELARRRPHPRHLTMFYLTVSAGGALGGLFVAFVAPRFFRDYWELPIGMIACAALACVVTWQNKWARLILPVAAAGLAGYLAGQEVRSIRGYRLIVRNFYGVLKVHDEAGGEDSYRERVLTHGTIQHGSQILDEGEQYETTAYYGRFSGVGRAIREFQSNGPVKVGVVGLGAGVLSNYGRKGDVFRFYEINPLVPKIATTEFSFFTHADSEKKIELGDARLVMEREPPQGFDVLAVDAFSSDAIPVHLLTREAMQLYSKHMKPGGAIALHVSNRYLDLVPVCALGAESIGRKGTVVEDDPEEGYLSSSTWVVVVRDDSFFKHPVFEGANLSDAKAKKGIRMWTDDYSNLIQILK